MRKASEQKSQKNWWSLLQKQRNTSINPYADAIVSKLQTDDNQEKDVKPRILIASDIAEGNPKLHSGEDKEAEPTLLITCDQSYATNIFGDCYLADATNIFGDCYRADAKSKVKIIFFSDKILV